MSVEVKQTAISGVAASTEATIKTTYPSIACMGIGRGLGQLFDCLPIRIGGIKLSYILFVLPLAPLAAALYLLLKATGSRYTVTNRNVQIWQSLGSRKLRQVPLTSIEDVTILQQPGQQYYRAGDIILHGKGGEVLLTLEGVPYPHVFRLTLLEVRDSRVSVVKSLETIQARKS